jgi:TonB family protein
MLDDKDMRIAWLLLMGVLASGTGQVQQPAEVAPMHIGGAVKPPKVVWSEEPQLPSTIRAFDAFSAQIYLWVNEKGETSHVKVIKSSGRADMDEAFVVAVKKYKFAPATLNGNPVTVDLYMDVNVN